LSKKRSQKFVDRIIKLCLLLLTICFGLGCWGYIRFQETSILATAMGIFGGELLLIVVRQLVSRAFERKGKPDDNSEV